MQLTEFVVTIADPSETLSIGVDESYTISFQPEHATSRTATHVTLSSVKASAACNTVWGALRALETFSQLIEYSEEYNAYTIKAPISIKDNPRFAWRFEIHSFDVNQLI